MIAPNNRRFKRLLTTGLTCFSLLIAAPAAAEAERHPSDGPHVDLAIRLDADALRMQVTMNLFFLDDVLSFTREDGDRIDPSEGPALLDALQAWGETEMAARIDGIDVAPLVNDLLINDPDDSLLALFPRTGMRGIRKIRFLLEWPLNTPPQEIVLRWSAFPPDIAIDPVNPPPLEIVADAAFEGVRVAVFFTEQSPTWLWRSGSTAIEDRLAPIDAPQPTTPTLVPAVSIALSGVALIGGLVLLVRSDGKRAIAGPALMLVGALGAWAFAGFGLIEVGGARAALALPKAAQAEATFVPLHANIYRAFDYVEESDIYDALERSVEGELLEDLYRTIHRSLVMEEEEGAISRVVAVRPVSLVVTAIAEQPDAEEPTIGFDALYRWQVDGRVTHWGHMHERTNEYLARFEVVGTASGWRIAAINLLEQERIATVDDPDAVEPDESSQTPFDPDDEDFEL